MGKVTFNESAILAKFLKSETVQKRASAALKTKVGKAKQELIDEFNDSPVTQELEAGPDVTESKVLPSGYGNLFSFLGFNDNRDPVAPVREQLEKISIAGRPRVTDRKWIFSIKAPSTDDLERISPMDWETGRSWISAVTKGLSGFSHYLQSLSRKLGRSTGGEQVKPEVRPGEYFAGTPYIIGMIGRFRRKFQR